MSTAGASELMRSLGLLVDGPAVWGRAVVAGGAPGVFIVELPGGADEAPIDDEAIRRWLERVSDLTLDGERPTTRELARRLASFWLPTEPILYVGRARRAIGARVAAMYATPLGDARPSPAGHWLRTLSVLPRLRIWWAATEAHEEYEDELLAQIRQRQSDDALAGLADRSVVLPFANLATTTGERKRHGIANDVRETGEATASAAPVTPGRPRRPPVRRAPARQSARATVAPPPAAPTYLSESGIAGLQAELDQLRSTERPAVIERVKTARELGDLRENADYEAARNEQSFLEGRIQALEGLLRTAVVAEPAVAGGVVAVGSTVVVEIDGDTAEWRLVGSSEADPAAGRISYASPVGQALLGRRAGDEVTAQLPRGQARLTVREVR